MEHKVEGGTNYSWFAWDLEKELEISERIETIQTTAWLRSVRILRRVPEILGDLLSDSSERLPANVVAKENLRRSKQQL